MVPSRNRQGIYLNIGAQSHKPYYVDIKIHIAFPYKRNIEEY
jgi:hypothetical protein